MCNYLASLLGEDAACLQGRLFVLMSMTVRHKGPVCLDVAARRPYKTCTQLNQHLIMCGHHSELKSGGLLYVFSLCLALKDTPLLC